MALYYEVRSARGINMKKYGLLIVTAFLFSLILMFGSVNEVKADALEFELDVESIAPTNEDVVVDVYADFDNIVEAKWESGKQTVDYFADAGEDVLISRAGGYFYVKKNGEYSVYLEDEKGNKSVQTIKIGNIDKKKPELDCKLDARDRSKAVITLTYSDDVAVKNVIYYYGRLKDADDERWSHGIYVEGNTFEAYKNATISIKVTDTAGNARIKYINIKYINRTNLNVNYGMKEKIQVVSYYGNIQLSINSIEPIMLEEDRPGYVVSYYLQNLSYGGKNTCYSTNRNFKVYDKKGKELETSCLEQYSDNSYAAIVPKVILSSTGDHCSFIVYGKEEPAYLDYCYWNDSLNREYLRILCKEDYDQMSTEQVIPKSTTTMEFVEDYRVSGGSYTGFLVNKLMQGVGTLKYDDGNVYVGEFYGGQCNGYGMLTYATEAVYKGEFIKGKREGYGVLYEHNGLTYAGAWENDNMRNIKLTRPNGEFLWMKAKD